MINEWQLIRAIEDNKITIEVIEKIVPAKESSTRQTAYYTREHSFLHRDDFYISVEEAQEAYLNHMTELAIKAKRKRNKLLKIAGMDYEFTINWWPV